MFNLTRKLNVYSSTAETTLRSVRSEFFILFNVNRTKLRIIYFHYKYLKMLILKIYDF